MILQGILTLPAPVKGGRVFWKPDKKIDDKFYLMYP